MQTTVGHKSFELSVVNQHKSSTTAEKWVQA